MSKGNVSVNITNNEYAFIDGASGQEISKEEFASRHKKVGLGGFRMANTESGDSK